MQYLCFERKNTGCCTFCMRMRTKRDSKITQQNGKFNVVSYCIFLFFYSWYARGEKGPGIPGTFGLLQSGDFLVPDLQGLQVLSCPVLSCPVPRPSQDFLGRNSPVGKPTTDTQKKPKFARFKQGYHCMLNASHFDLSFICLCLHTYVQCSYIIVATRFAVENRKANELLTIISQIPKIPNF